MIVPSLKPHSSPTDRPFVRPSMMPASKRRVSVVIGLAVVASLSFGLWLGHHASTHHRVEQRVLGEAKTRLTSTGDAVRWLAPAITLTIDPSFASLTSDATGVVGIAVDTWKASGASLPDISIDSAPSHAPIANDGKNTISFAPNGYAPAGEALAITILTIDDDTGEVLDADIVFNGASHEFTTMDPGEQSATDTRYDLPSVLTHELGHFWGLGEDYQDTSTTMYLRTAAGTTNKRVLSTPDLDAIHSLYPPSASSKKGCSIDGGLPSAVESPTAPLLFAFVSLVTVARRRRLRHPRLTR